MNFSAADDTIFIPNESHPETMPFTLVNSLLGVILADQTEKFYVKTHSHHFPHNPGTGMKRGDTLTTQVECQKISSTEDDVEVTFSGTVKNQFGHQDRCRLYFFLCWDHTAIDLPQISRSCTKPLKSRSLFIFSESSPTYLPDTAFILQIYRKTLSGAEQFLAQGHTYLSFGHQY